MQKGIKVCQKAYPVDGMMKKTVSKEKMLSEIAGRVQKLLEERQLTQAQLIKMIQSVGYEVSQPDVSKMLSGRTKPTLYLLTAISDVLEISLDQLVGNSRSAAPLQIESGNLLIDPDKCDGFTNLDGSYYLYFETTNRYEQPNLLKGKLCFEKKAGYCKAELKLEIVRNGKTIPKNYAGQLILSSKMHAGYVFLYNSTIAEMCFFVFRFRNFLVREMACRLGVAVTISSGETKIPTVHRLLLSRQELSPQQLEEIWPYLRLSDEELVVDEEEFLHLMEQHPDKPILRSIYNISKKRSYFLVSEVDIRRADRKISHQEIARLRRYFLTAAQIFPNHQITEAEDSRLFYLLENEDAEIIKTDSSPG